MKVQNPAQEIKPLDDEVIPRALIHGTLVVIALALVVNMITAPQYGANFAGYCAIASATFGIALGWRRSWLGVVLVAVSPALAVAGGLPSTGVWSIGCFAVFLVTLRGMRVWICSGVVALGNLLAVAWEAGTLNLQTNAGASIAAFSALAAGAFGSAIRGNLQYRREVENREREAERTRLAAVERGIAQERLRIARDLHDGIGHQIAVINMRLGAAEVHLPPGAEAAREDLAGARQGVQAVLQETQQVLRVLRLPEESTHTSSPLGTLSDLVTSFQEAGMELDVQLDASAITTSSRESDAALYRIVQEGLTNAQKYGRGTTSLTGSADESDVHIQIVNMRSRRIAPDTSSGGNGIIGMTERAESVGGSLTARVDGRLFWLEASVPHGRGSL